MTAAAGTELIRPRRNGPCSKLRQAACPAPLTSVGRLGPPDRRPSCFGLQLSIKLQAASSVADQASAVIQVTMGILLRVSRTDGPVGDRTCLWNNLDEADWVVGHGARQCSPPNFTQKQVCVNSLWFEQPESATCR